MASADTSPHTGFVALLEHSFCVPGTIPETPDSELEVNVLFTRYKKTLSALRTAGILARQLRARIRLLAPRVVPYRLPINEPPVGLAFVQQQLIRLIEEAPAGLPVSACVYLCRDKQACFLGLLRPRSLVVLGDRKPWWSMRDTSLTRALRSQGHQVIIAGRD